MTARSSPAEEPLLTLEEFEKLPEEDFYRVELVRGRLVREPRPAALHGLVLNTLAYLLTDHVRAHDLGYVFVDSGVILTRDPDTVRGPDLCFAPHARLPYGPPEKGFLDFAPDLCVEVVSPSNTRREIREKIREYFAGGTRLAWVVHPKQRTVTQYSSSADHRVLDVDDILDGRNVLPAFRATHEDIFTY